MRASAVSNARICGASCAAEESPRSIIILEVVIPVRQTEAALVDLQRVLRRVACVLGDPDVEGSRHVDLLEVSDERGQAFLVVDGLDRSQLGLQGMHPEAFYP